MKFLTFGELLLRLTPPGHTRLSDASSFTAHFGGAEANVACSLARLGDSAAFVTRLPQNPLGEAALAHLRAFGVDISGVLRGGERLGLYYYEPGVDARRASVVYDRAHSAFAESAPEMYPWQTLLAGREVLHLSGITPALGGALPAIVKEAVKAAKTAGVRVSFDPNYRAKLWPPEAAAAFAASLLPSLDLLIVNEQQARFLFAPLLPDNLPGQRLGQSAPDGSDAFPTFGDCRRFARAFCARFSLPRLALTCRRTLLANVNTFTAFYYDLAADVFVAAPVYKIDMVDRVGGGDAFAAGLLHALGQRRPPDRALAFAVAASVLAHSFEGDVNLATEAEIDALAASQSLAVER